ncbi:hypothetical protein IT570_05805 [Candidatus Sumerlaeota bacterium]|nr:hypothetical protein [Candidatus Sumerlaeota bacterium]
MKKVFFSLMLVSACTMGQAAVLFQADAAPGEINTLPATVGASFDGGTDVIVVANATQSPTPIGDHSGGDGHSFRVGDINPGGGAFNFAYVATPPVNTDVVVSAWYYIDFTNGLDGTPVERDYIMMARLDTPNPFSTSPFSRQGYYLAVSLASSWPSLGAPPDRKPYLMKRNNDGTYTQIGSYGVADVTDGWHRLQLVCEGTTIRGYIDGVEVASGTDATYATGTGAAWGFYEDNGSPNFPTAGSIDNLLVESINSSVNGEWQFYN